MLQGPAGDQGPRLWPWVSISDANLEIVTDAKMETEFFCFFFWCTGGLMIFSHENDPAMVCVCVCEQYYNSVIVCWQWAGRETYVSTLSLSFHAGQTEVC